MLNRIGREITAISPKYPLPIGIILIFEKKYTMANRLRITGFARFFIFLIISAPLIYSGVSIYKGDHPLDALNRDFGINLRGGQTEQVDTPKNDNDTAQLDKLTKRLDYLRDKNEELEIENETLKERIKELEGQ